MDKGIEGDPSLSIKRTEVPREAGRGGPHGRANQGP